MWVLLKYTCYLFAIQIYQGITSSYELNLAVPVIGHPCAERRGETGLWFLVNSGSTSQALDLKKHTRAWTSIGLSALKKTLCVKCKSCVYLDMEVRLGVNRDATVDSLFPGSPDFSYSIICVNQEISKIFSPTCNLFKYSWVLFKK